MTKAIFEAIRREEVVLWAGAGLSMYAGFPTGNQLREIFFKSLNEDEKKLIDKNLLLPDFAEELFRIKGGNKDHLIEVLKATFEVEPQSIAYHNKLAGIPHIQSVITTNYDRLFELAYGEKGQVLLSPNHIPQIDKARFQVFKVHGDLSVPQSVIITKSDYTNFFKSNSADNIYWTVIKERLVTKNVLFLGYNLEDPNVSVVFEQITDALDQRKACFLVAPNLPQHKIDDLNRKKIEYINSTGEAFIDDLLGNIKENIIEDMEKGLVSPETFRKFLLAHNLLPDLKSDKQSFRLSSIRGLDGDVEGRLDFSLHPDSNILPEFRDFLAGINFDKIDINGSEFAKLDLSIGGIKFLNPDKTGQLSFQSNPRLTATVSIVFDSGYEYTDFEVKLFISKVMLEIRAVCKNAKLIFRTGLKEGENKFHMQYAHDTVCKTVKEEIEFFELLKRLASGEVFSVYNDSKMVLRRSLPHMEPFLNEANYFLAYFQNLKTIEAHYNIRFMNIETSSIDESTYRIANKIVVAIRGERVVQPWDDEMTMEFDSSKINMEQIKSINEVSAPMEAQFSTQEVIELHGHSLSIGYKKIEFLNSYVVNLNEIINKTEDFARVRSKSKEIAISYLKSIE